MVARDSTLMVAGLHMPLERFSSLEGALHGVVEQCLGRGGPVARLKAPRRSMFFSTKAC